MGWTGGGGGGAFVTYNLISYQFFGQWVVFVGGSGSFSHFSQSGSGIHSYVLCVGWAFIIGRVVGVYWWTFMGL